MKLANQGLKANGIAYYITQNKNPAFNHLRCQLAFAACEHI